MIRKKTFLIPNYVLLFFSSSDKQFKRVTRQTFFTMKTLKRKNKHFFLKLKVLGGVNQLRTFVINITKMSKPFYK